jgi:hypothetical protein
MSCEIMNLSMRDTAERALALPLSNVNSFFDIFLKLSSFPRVDQSVVEGHLVLGGGFPPVHLTFPGSTSSLDFFLVVEVASHDGVFPR